MFNVMLYYIYQLDKGGYEVKTIYKGIRMPIDLIERIQKYQTDNYFQSFTQAVISLVIKGLELEGKR